MAVAFSEQERTKIRQALLSAAQECMKTTGIRKTTVDDLARRAGISKGAFYLFYESKELLFLDVLNEFQLSVNQMLFERIAQGAKIDAQGIANVMVDLFCALKDSFLPSLLVRNEFEYLLRKLPDELIAQHQGMDDVMAERLLSIPGLRSEYGAEVISAALRAVFLTLLHEKEIGEEQFCDALKLLVVSVCKEIFKE